MKRAPAAARLLAFLVDIAFLSCVSALILLSGIAGYLTGLGRFRPIDPIETLRIFLTAFVFLKLFLFVFYFTYLTAHGEQTIGKAAFGLKVVRRADGRDIGLGRALARACCYAVSGFPLFLGFFMAFLLKGRALHDMLTGTEAIRGNDGKG